jgi:hypothetical protein
MTGGATTGGRMPTPTRRPSPSAPPSQIPPQERASASTTTLTVCAIRPHVQGGGRRHGGSWSVGGAGACVPAAGVLAGRAGIRAARRWIGRRRRGRRRRGRRRRRRLRRRLLWRAARDGHGGGAGPRRSSSGAAGAVAARASPGSHGVYHGTQVRLLWAGARSADSGAARSSPTIRSLFDVGVRLAAAEWVELPSSSRHYGRALGAEPRELQRGAFLRAMGPSAWRKGMRAEDCNGPHRIGH